MPKLPARYLTLDFFIKLVQGRSSSAPSSFTFCSNEFAPLLAATKKKLRLTKADRFNHYKIFCSPTNGWDYRRNSFVRLGKLMGEGGVREGGDVVLSDHWAHQQARCQEKHLLKSKLQKIRHKSCKSALHFDTFWKLGACDVDLLRRRSKLPSNFGEKRLNYKQFKLKI